MGARTCVHMAALCNRVKYITDHDRSISGLTTEFRSRVHSALHQRTDESRNPIGLQQHGSDCTVSATGLQRKSQADVNVLVIFFMVAANSIAKGTCTAGAPHTRIKQFALMEGWKALCFAVSQ